MNPDAKEKTGMNPDSPCAPGVVVSERVVIMEQELRHVAEGMHRLERSMHGRLDSLNNDVHVTLDEMKSNLTRLDIIVRGERGDNGLTSLVSDLIRREQGRKRRDAIFVGALVSAVTVQIVTTLWPS